MPTGPVLILLVTTRYHNFLAVMALQTPRLPEISVITKAQSVPSMDMHTMSGRQDLWQFLLPELQDNQFRGPALINSQTVGVRLAIHISALVEDTL